MSDTNEARQTGPLERMVGLRTSAFAGLDVERRRKAKREHTANADCWCAPVLDYVSDDGDKVWIHRVIQ